MNNRSNGADNEKAEQIVLPSLLYLRTARQLPRTHFTARRKAGEAAELFRCLEILKLEPEVLSQQQNIYRTGRRSAVSIFCKLNRTCSSVFHG